MELGDSAMLATTFGKKKRNDTSHNYNSKSNQKGKGRIPPQADIKKENKCIFCKRTGHVKKIVLNSRSGMRRKVIYHPLFVMNLIWLMLILTPSGLILVLQSILQTLCRVCKT